MRSVWSGVKDDAEEGVGIVWCATSSAEAMQVEYAAEEPSPAEMGRLEEAVKVAEKLIFVSCEFRCPWWSNSRF